MKTSADGLYRPDGRQTEIYLPKRSVANGDPEGEPKGEPEEGEEEDE